MDSSEGDVEVSYARSSLTYMCAGVRHQPTHPAPPPFPPTPSPGLREPPLLLFIVQDPSAPTTELGRVHIRFGELDPPSSVSITETRPRVVAFPKGSFTALDFPPSIIPASCYMLAFSIRIAFSINLCLLLKGGKAQIIGPEEEYEDDYSYAFNDVSVDGSLSSAPPRGVP